MSGFHFIRPEALWALLFVLPLAIWLARHNGSRNDWSRICDANLLAALQLTQGKRSRSLWVWWLIPSWIVMVLALAGPSWTETELPVFKTDQAVVIVLDLSRAMNTADLTPSRLVRVRHKITDLLARNADGRNALVVYAGDAHIVAPLTDDAQTLTHLLAVLSPNLMPVRGSRPDLGLEKAVELLQRGNVGKGRIILLTHRVENSSALSRMTESLRSQGVELSVLGVGTVDGAPVTDDQGAFIKDSRGAIVISRLDEASLQALASAGGGRYARIAYDDRDLDALTPIVAPGTLDPGDQLTQIENQWLDQGIWLVLALLPLAAFAFRRGYLWALLPLFLIFSPDNAHARSWQDYWQHADEQGYSAFIAKDYETASHAFKDPAWQAATAYRQGDFAKAAQQYAALEGAHARYNQGNALAQAKNFKEAIAAYEQALKLDPKLKEALDNLVLIKSLLEQQESQESQESSQDKGDKESQDNKENKDSKENQSGDEGDRNGEGKENEQKGSEQQDNQNSQQTKDGQSDPESQGEKSTSDSPSDQMNADDKNGEDGKDGQSNQDQHDLQEVEEGQVGEDAKEESDNQDDLADKESKAAARAQQLEAMDPVERERLQATEQWLKKIPDDPGRLLRNKFYFKSRQRVQQGSLKPSEELW